MNLRDQIEQVLREHPDGLTAAELGQKMEWEDTGELEHSLQKMSYKNKVIKDNEGKWKVN